MKIAIYTDCHIGAPHSVLKKNPEIKRELLAPEMVKAKYGVKKVFCLGDIYDVDNCKKKHVKKYRLRALELKEIHGNNTVSGNHECEDGTPYYKVIDGIMITHGHYFLWDYEKVLKWERKKGGMVFWKFKAYQLFMHFGRVGKPWNPSFEVLEALSSTAKENGAHTVLLGHTHRVFDDVYRGVRIINVSKGRTIVEI